MLEEFNASGFGNALETPDKEDKYEEPKTGYPFGHDIGELVSPPNPPTDASKDKAARYLIRAVDLGSPQNDILVRGKTPGLKLFGWMLRESSGGTSALVIRNGVDINGPAFADYFLPSRTIDKQWFGPNGVDAEEGIYFQYVSGNTRVILFIGALC